MRTLAIIPARAENMRLPGKNILPIAGKPCLLYTIEHIRAANAAIYPVLLSNDMEALRLGADVGVQTIWEPDELARDDDIFHAIRYAMRQKVAGTFNLVLLAWANCPIRPPNIFDRMIEKLYDEQIDFVGVVKRVGADTHPFRMWHLDHEGRPAPYCLGNLVMNSQDFPPIYANTAVGVLMTWKAAERLAENRHEAMKSISQRMLAIGPSESVDIDTPQDRDWAEFLLTRGATRCQRVDQATYSEARMPCTI